VFLLLSPISSPFRTISFKFSSSLNTEWFYRQPCSWTISNLLLFVSCLVSVQQVRSQKIYRMGRDQNIISTNKK
jgi:hypothetical protein